MKRGTSQTEMPHHRNWEREQLNRQVQSKALWTGYGLANPDQPMSTNKSKDEDLGQNAGTSYNRTRVGQEERKVLGRLTAT